MNSEMTRRRDFKQMTEAEKVLYTSVVEIEKMPAHPKLTEAQSMVINAMTIVSDYVDGKFLENESEYSKVTD